MNTENRPLCYGDCDISVVLKKVISVKTVIPMVGVLVESLNGIEHPHYPEVYYVLTKNI